MPRDLPRYIETGSFTAIDPADVRDYQVYVIPYVPADIASALDILHICVAFLGYPWAVDRLLHGIDPPGIMGHSGYKVRATPEQIAALREWADTFERLNAVEVVTNA